TLGDSAGRRVAARERATCTCASGRTRNCRFRVSLGRPSDMLLSTAAITRFQPGSQKPWPPGSRGWPTAGRWTGISCGNSSGLRDKYRNTTKLPKVRGGVLAQLPRDAPPAAAYPAPWRRGAEGATVTKPSTAAAAIVGATVVTFLGGFVALFGVGQSAKSEKKEVTQLGPASS